MLRRQLQLGSQPHPSTVQAKPAGWSGEIGQHKANVLLAPGFAIAFALAFFTTAKRVSHTNFKYYVPKNVGVVVMGL